MANSSLQRTGEEDPIVTRGHGTRALGPSDSTDSGSDIAGGPGLNDPDALGLDRGTTSDADVDGPGANAGADIGDADLDSDSDRYGTGERGADRYGTGERGAAGRDSTLPTDEIMRERELEPESMADERPHDFSDRRHPDRATTEPLDDAMDDDAIERLEDLEDEQAASTAPAPADPRGSAPGGSPGTSRPGGRGGSGPARTTTRR
jgi:hypothetical protein